MFENFSFKLFMKPVVLGLVGFVVLFRITLPYMAKYIINHGLQTKLENYKGYIDDVDISLWRGAYQIEGLTISKRQSELSPFLVIKTIDLSVAWRKILISKISFDIKISKPYLHMKDAQDKEKREFGTNEENKNWKETNKFLFPLDMANLQIENGMIIFENYDLKTEVKLKVEDIFLNLRNLTLNDLEQFSPVSLSATIQQTGKLSVDGKINFEQSIPNLNLDFRLENLKPARANELLRTYIPIDFSRGTLSIFGEVVSDQNTTKGYAKVFLYNSKIVATEQKFLSTKHVFIEFTSEFFTWLIENESQNTVAVEIPFVRESGEWNIDNSKVFWSGLINKFEELEPTIEKRY